MPPARLILCLSAGMLLACTATLRAETVGRLCQNDVTCVLVEVRVEGNEQVSAGTIRDAMLTKLPPWYKPWQRLSWKLWKGIWKYPEVNPSVFENDLERIRAELRDSGFYEAGIRHEAIPQGDVEWGEQRIVIVIQVDEGAPALLDEIFLEVDDFELDEAEERRLREKIPLQVGQRLVQEKYDEGWAALQRHFEINGYAYARVEKAALVDTDEDIARVLYEIHRGPLAHFGETRYEGLQSVDQKLLDREQTYEKGAVYDPRKLETTQAHMFGLELFRSVVVEPANLEEESGTVDVAVRVIEGDPRRIKIGVGYGLEDELRGQIEYQDNNFLGGGRQLTGRLKGSSIEQSFGGELRQPYFFHPKQTLVVPLIQKRLDEPGFELLQTRLSPRVEREVIPNFTISLGYNIEYDDLTSFPEDARTVLGELQTRGFLSSLNANLEWNTANDLLDPTTGTVLNLSIEQAGGPWRGDFSFYQAAFVAKHYLPIFREQTLAGRFRIGAGDGFGQSGDLPLFRRFYAGGVNSTRGYGRHDIGPTASDGAPLGGRSLLEGNLEIRTPLWWGFGAVAFLDTATVDLDPFTYDLGNLEYGVGPGIRYNTPVGPIRLDVGFPLDPGPNEDRWEIHFSIGQAF